MEEKFSAQEKRKFRRVGASFTVFYRVNSPLSVRMVAGNREIDAVALDLSEEGMAVLSNYEIPELTMVTVKFMAINESAIREQDRSRSLEILGEVRYSIPAKNKAYRLGVHFINLMADDRRFLENFVKMQK